MSGLLARWGVSLVGLAAFEAVVLRMLYRAFKHRRAPYLNGWMTAYYVERDKNPVGYWLTVMYIGAFVVIAPLIVFAT